LEVVHVITWRRLTSKLGGANADVRAWQFIYHASAPARC